MRPSPFLLAVALLFPAAPAQAAEQEGPTLRVLTFNVWHGLRSGESRKRFPGEDAERAERRFQWQIEEIRRLDPDVLMLQEVNPNQRRARRYAEVLGYDEIHKVTSCGLHLGKLYKIPRNVNEGLAILARESLDLRRAGTKRLSGNARCTASWGFQTKESRYALFGRIKLAGRELLLANTHLSSPTYVPPGFEQELERMVAEGTLTGEQRDEIVEILERKRDRNEAEATRLLGQIERRGREAFGVILAGDFNTEPETETIRILDSRLSRLASGPEFHSWDPPTNRVNFEIGSKRSQPLPTFDHPEILELLALRETTSRQIDHAFATAKLELIEARRVLDRERDGIFPSDHFGILVELRLPDAAPGD